MGTTELGRFVAAAVDIALVAAAIEDIIDFDLVVADSSTAAVKDIIATARVIVD